MIRPFANRLHRRPLRQCAVTLLVGGALLLGLAAATSGPAAAQGIASDMDFRGMTSLRITASPTTVESLDCGLESTGLVRELQRQFESGGMKPTDSDAALGVITILSARDSDRGLCNSTIMLGAYKKASFFDKDVGWIRSGYVVVWQSAVLVASPAESHALQVRDALTRLGDALLGDWLTANRPATSAVSQ